MIPDREDEIETGGRKIRLRPIEPEDEQRLHDFFARLSPEDVRMRFLQPLKRLPEPLAQRLSHLDPAREMALVADDATDEILGVGRMSTDSSGTRAEFALTVRTDTQGLGLGHILMERLLDHAWERGIGEVFGDVLAENAKMLDLCRSLGCEVRQHPEDSTLLRVVFLRPGHRT
jgi:acetyltransferase